MAIPTSTGALQLTPSAKITLGIAEDTKNTSSFYQLVSTSTFIVFDGVPHSIIANIKARPDPDTAIATLLSAYPRRIVAVS